MDIYTRFDPQRAWPPNCDLTTFNKQLQDERRLEWSDVPGAHQCPICTIRSKKNKKSGPINKIQRVTKLNLSTLFQRRWLHPIRRRHAELVRPLLTGSIAALGFFTVHTRVGRARHRLSLCPSHWLCHSGRAPPSPVYKASLAGGVKPRLPPMVSVAALETTASAAAPRATHSDEHPWCHSIACRLRPWGKVTLKPGSPNKKIKELRASKTELTS